MNKSNWCEKCPFYRVYYHGTINNPSFTERCIWSWVDPKLVKSDECYIFQVGMRVFRVVEEVTNEKK